MSRRSHLDARSTTNKNAFFDRNTHTAVDQLIIDCRLISYRIRPAAPSSYSSLDDSSTESTSKKKWSDRHTSRGLVAFLAGEGHNKPVEEQILYASRTYHAF